MSDMTAHYFMLTFGVLMLVAALIAGIIIFIRCWRGKRIDDHPLCRRCGYDLIGSPEPRNNCPECGTNLTTPKNIVIGHRKRQTVSAAIAGLVTLASATMLLVVTFFFIRMYILD